MPDPVIPLFVFDTPVDSSNLESLIVRRNYNALGRSNWTTDTSYPQNPRNGMIRVLDENGAGTNIQLQMYINTWVTIISHLEVVLSLGRRREIQVLTSSVSWQIDHGLGVKPLIQVFDTSNNELTPTNVEHVLVGSSWDRIIVTLGAPSDGYAIVVG